MSHTEEENFLTHVSAMFYLFLVSNSLHLLSAVVLRVHDLHPDLHDGVRVLDELLAGPQVRPRPRGPHHHHAARHVHHHLQHQQLPAPGGLHQGGLMVFRPVRDV